MLGGLRNSCAKSQIRYLWYLLDQIENCSFERAETEGSFSSRDNDDVQNATLDQGRVLSPPTTLHIHTCTLYNWTLVSNSSKNEFLFFFVAGKHWRSTVSNLGITRQSLEN